MTMPRFLWVDGRFSWWLVGAVIFLTVSALGFDMAWRLVKIQFDTLVLYGIVVEFAAAAALLLIARRWRGGSTG
jgi:hypothetical protein